MIIDIIGQWSEQTALDFEKELHQKTSHLAGSKYAHIVSFEDWELSTPKVESIAQRVISWSERQGMCIVAEVYSNNVLKEYLLDKAVEEKVKQKLIIRRFSNKSEAEIWVAEASLGLNHSAN
ncbi:hypothetical protein L0668_08895 [Paraglaciecola aquimarina]|uniref:STAS/SEC14 domain-containing protein n=1 Tax=Paraglaciecola algarum TaxID=3050085 RepID=A0ABS9D612_9ALTE|nr:hypothetical protein [Paraglaciecola sp. G1-23]